MTVLDAPRNGARRHPAFVVAVGGLEHRVDAERRAMCEQRRLLIGVKRAERRPQLGRSVGQTVGPDLVTFVDRSEEHTSELQSLMRISYAVFCLKQNKKQTKQHIQ